MSSNGPPTIGLFSSDPWSRRVTGLHTALYDLGEAPIRVIPWSVTQDGTSDNYIIRSGNVDISSLDTLFIVDLGADDIGAFFNRIGFLTALTEMGVEVVNSVSSILVMRNKAETIRRLLSVNLPVPDTLITESIEEAAEFVNQNHPCVLKPITGFGGLGVQLIERDFDIEHIFDYLKFHSRRYGKGAFLLQKYIKSPGFDIRALVLDGEVIGTMQRVGGTGIVTNIHAGATPQLNDIDVNDLALQTAKAVDGRLVGVDIISDMEDKLWVLEANATPGWTGLQSVTDTDLTQIIATALSNT
ncbi:MAG: RimK family alpha-L-glutamate ligase [Candidatus Thorarchaeota archaeon]